MVLQRRVPGGLLAPHHPGPGPATRPLSPPVSTPFAPGPVVTPKSPLPSLSLLWCAPPTTTTSSSFDCLDHVSIYEPSIFPSSFCFLLLTPPPPPPSALLLPFLIDVSFLPLPSSVSYFSGPCPPMRHGEVNTGIYGSH